MFIYERGLGDGVVEAAVAIAVAVVEVLPR